MGQAAAARSSLKESDVLDMNQKEIMRQFHDGRCNLLVATSVLEEGVDIPACNLIIRFDKIRTYCDYVQTKGTLSNNLYSIIFVKFLSVKLVVFANRESQINESILLYAGE